MNKRWVPMTGTNKNTPENPRCISSPHGKHSGLRLTRSRPAQLHVFQGCFDALSLLGCSSLFAGDAGRLEVLPTSRLRNNRFLLHTLGEPPEETLKALAVVDSNFYQQFSCFMLTTAHLMLAANQGLIWIADGLPSSISMHPATGQSEFDRLSPGLECDRRPRKAWFRLLLPQPTAG